MQQKMVCADPVTGRLYYTANWLDDGVGAGGTGLYLWRALEFLKTPTRYEGLGMGGRVPGKININTNLTPQVFAGVCDAQVSNRFSEVGAIPGTVQNAWTLIDGTIRAGAAQRFQTGNDRPIWGLATAVTPAGTSPAGNIVPLDQRQTLVMPNGFWASSAPGNFNEAFTKGGGGSAGTLQKFEMLNKVFNNFTTRSNCFAIYATVGYFEVRNPGPYNEANRPVLGKELGIDEGQVTRHRFFSIVDRTNLTIELPTATGIPVRQGPAPVYLSYQPNTELPWPGNMAP
jgi:hypothetical protein